MKQALTIAARDAAGISDKFIDFLLNLKIFFCVAIDFCIAVHYLPEGNFKANISFLIKKIIFFFPLY